MVVSLLPLTTGGCSLEFDTGDIDRVREYLRQRFGAPRVEHHPFHIVYKFRQADLLFQNEWDDPCLIASTEDGVAMLRLAAGDLAGR